MSPSESQLRAALREGQGDGVDAGAVIAHAHGVRAARRRRINVAVVATVAIGFVGLGSAALLNNGSDQGGSSAGRHADRAGALAPSVRSAPGAAGGALSPQPSPNSAPLTTVKGCPQHPSRILAPATAGGADLVPTSVRSITACGYAPDLQSQKVIKGADASQVANALNHAPSRPSARPNCAEHGAPVRTIQLLPVDRSGRRYASVVIRLTCPQTTATNGDVVRYPVRIPDQLKALVR